MFGRALRAPLLVSCMTGGVSEAGPVNRALAAAAQHHGVALGLGSGRALLEDPGAERASFAVRSLAPDVPLLANLGAVQLARHGVEGCARLVDLCEADVLVLHLNAVQEAVQPGGDTDFGGVLARIAEVCAGLAVPVLVKEVGFGLGPADIADLAAAGVAGVDVAGAGGTNWAAVEGLRDADAGAVAAAFRSWGWPTVDAVRHARAGLGPGQVVIGSGGLRHGVDAAEGAVPGRRPRRVRALPAERGGGGPRGRDARPRRARPPAAHRRVGRRRAVVRGPRRQPGRLTGAQALPPPAPPHQPLADHREAEHEVLQRHPALREDRPRRAPQPRARDLRLRVGDDRPARQPAVDQHLEEQHDRHRDPEPPVAEHAGPQHQLQPGREQQRHAAEQRVPQPHPRRRSSTATTASYPRIPHSGTTAKNRYSSSGNPIAATPVIRPAT